MANITKLRNLGYLNVGLELIRVKSRLKGMAGCHFQVITEHFLVFWTLVDSALKNYQKCRSEIYNITKKIVELTFLKCRYFGMFRWVHEHSNGADRGVRKWPAEEQIWRCFYQRKQWYSSLSLQITFLSDNDSSKFQLTANISQFQFCN
jgi:hypothetical protein